MFHREENQHHHAVQPPMHDLVGPSGSTAVAALPEPILPFREAQPCTTQSCVARRRRAYDRVQRSLESLRQSRQKTETLLATGSELGLSNADLRLLHNEGWRPLDTALDIALTSLRLDALEDLSTIPLSVLTPA